MSPLPPLEIERKFLLAVEPPDLARAIGTRLEQGYVAISVDAEVRLRRAGERRTMTVKSTGDLVRREVEIELDGDQFESLWPTTEGRRVDKTRYRLRHCELVVELDLYHGVLDGLATVEVEFDSIEASAAFEPPPWFGAEVTSDSRFKNRNLALQGLPGD
jgi:CYTH domain-containing protein